MKTREIHYFFLAICLDELYNKKKRKKKPIREGKAFLRQDSFGIAVPKSSDWYVPTTYRSECLGHVPFLYYQWLLYQRYYENASGNSTN